MGEHVAVIAEKFNLGDSITSFGDMLVKNCNNRDVVMYFHKNRHIIPAKCWIMAYIAIHYCDKPDDKLMKIIGVNCSESYRFKRIPKESIWENSELMMNCHVIDITDSHLTLIIENGEYDISDAPLRV